MSFDIEKGIALLARTPGALKALLVGLPDECLHANEGERTWSAFGVAAHLADLEHVDWMPRLAKILHKGASEPFDPIDRERGLREKGDRSLTDVLDDFAQTRAANIVELRRLGPGESDFARPGLHPALGPVTLANLLATWVAHDLDHLHQISRILAHQYRDEVGPWRRYLGVLACQGHGE